MRLKNLSNNLPIHLLACCHCVRRNHFAKSTKTCLSHLIKWTFKKERAPPRRLWSPLRRIRFRSKPRPTSWLREFRLQHKTDKLTKPSALLHQLRSFRNHSRNSPPLGSFWTKVQQLGQRMSISFKLMDAISTIKFKNSSINKSLSPILKSVSLQKLLPLKMLSLLTNQFSSDSTQMVLDSVKLLPLTLSWRARGDSQQLWSQRVNRDNQLLKFKRKSQQLLSNSWSNHQLLLSQLRNLK